MIGPSIKIKGEVTGDEDLVIQGSVDGSITLKAHAVSVGESGKVSADINAKSVKIDGEVNGDIKCLSLVQGPSSKIKGAIIAKSASLSGAVEGSIDAGDLVISSSARIGGDVVYENVTIEQGGHVDGKFKHQSSKTPHVAKSTMSVADKAPPLELTEGDKATA